MKHLSSLLLLTLLAGTGAARAQGGGAPVGWLKLSADVPLRDRWTLYLEAESRQANAQLATQQLGRLGFRLHLAPSLSLTTGYVLASNDCGPGDGLKAPEYRFCQEIALADVSGLMRASHCLRAEERWLRPTPEAAFRYAPRLRYQLQLVVPLRKGGALPVGGVYAVVADEEFAGLGRRDGASFLEENRVSAGLGYRISRLATMELAYLNQTQASGVAGRALARNAVQMSVAFAAPSHQALVRR